MSTRPTQSQTADTAHFPVAIGGVGGSGTSVVARIVSRMGVYLGRDLNQSHDSLSYTFLFRNPEVLTISDVAFAQRFDILRKALSGTSSLTSSEESAIDALVSGGSAPDTASKRFQWRTQRSRLLKADAQEMAANRPMWGWKEPNTHILLKRFFELSPNLKYIHVSRHGLDVATSSNQRQRARWSKFVLNRAFVDTPSEALKYWCAVEERMDAISRDHSRTILKIKFDQLCESPQPVIRTIAAFINVDLTDHDVASLAADVRTPTSIGRHRYISSDEFDEEDIAEVSNRGFGVDQQWLDDARINTQHSNPKMLMLQSAIFARQGCMNKALEVCQRARDMAPGNPRICRRLGELMIEHGDTQTGITLLGQALTLDQQKGSQNYAAHLSAARGLLKVQRREEAAIVCRQLLDDPGNKTPAQIKRAKRILAQTGTRSEQSRSAGHIPQADRLVPKFLIIGAQRSGTSFLHRCINSHPDVRLPGKKEIHFFDNKYAKGLDWYLAQFPFRDTDVSITGEATPYYLYHPLSASRIHKHFPKMKLLVILRNPAERAFSHHKWSTSKGNEQLNFKQALDAEYGRLAGETETLALGNGPSFSHQKHSYRDRGLYAGQLEQWLALFDRSQFLVLRSEELFNDPATALKAVWSFLGLRDHTVGDLNPVKSSPTNTPDLAIMQDLEDFYSPHNARLAKLLGMPFNW